MPFVEQVSHLKDVPPQHTPKVLKPVHTGFDEVLSFLSYLLISRDQGYDDYVEKNIAKPVKLVHVKRRHNTRDSADPISVFSFLSTFKTKCHSNRVSEEAAMWLFHFIARCLLVNNQCWSPLSRLVEQFASKRPSLVLRRRKLSTGHICLPRSHRRSST